MKPCPYHPQKALVPDRRMGGYLKCLVLGCGYRERA